MWKFYLFFIPNVSVANSQQLLVKQPNSFKSEIEQDSFKSAIEQDSFNYNYNRNLKRKKEMNCKWLYIFINFIFTLGFLFILSLMSINYLDASLRDDILHSHDAVSGGLFLIINGFFCQLLAACITTIEYNLFYFIRSIGQLFNIICSSIIFIGVLNDNSNLISLTGDRKQDSLTSPISNLYFGISCGSIFILLIFQFLCVKKTKFNLL